MSEAEAEETSEKIEESSDDASFDSTPIEENEEKKDA